VGEGWRSGDPGATNEPGIRPSLLLPSLLLSMRSASCKFSKVFVALTQTNKIRLKELSYFLQSKNSFRTGLAKKRNWRKPFFAASRQEHDIKPESLFDRLDSKTPKFMFLNDSVHTLPFCTETRQFGEPNTWWAVMVGIGGGPWWWTENIRQGWMGRGRGVPL
jgi:hypothetical protein